MSDNPINLSNVPNEYHEFADVFSIQLRVRPVRSHFRTTDDLKAELFVIPAGRQQLVLGCVGEGQVADVMEERCHSQR